MNQSGGNGEQHPYRETDGQTDLLLIIHIQTSRYDWSADVFGRVDYLFDTGNSQSDIHGRDASKVERLQGHLSSRFADALRTDRADSRAYKKQAER